MEDLLKQNKEILREKADEEQSYFLLSLTFQPDTVWEYLDFFVNYKTEETVGDKKKTDYPYRALLKSYTITKKKDVEGKGKVKVDNSYVNAVKTACKRYETLKEAIESENEASTYRKYQEAELEILDAYALNVVFDLLWINPKIFEDTKPVMEKWKADKEKAKQEKEEKAKQKRAEKAKQKKAIE